MNSLVILLALVLGQDAGQENGGSLPTMNPEQAAQEALVQRIKQNLALIDQLLLDTSDADDVRDGLDDVRSTQVEVVRDLEELIKQMKYSQSQQSSSGGGGESQDQPQGQPPPRESDGGQSQDQDQQQSGDQPKSPQEQQAEQQGQDQPQDQDGSQDSASAHNQPGGPPPPDPLGDFTREDTDDRWGLLPPKLQERLLNLHVDDIPERYRLWLEAYIRSMHRLESGDAR